MPTIRVTSNNDGRTQKSVLNHFVNVPQTASVLTRGLLCHLVSNGTDPFLDYPLPEQRQELIADAYRGFCYLIECIISGEVITGKAPLLVHVILRYLRPGRVVSDGVNALALTPVPVYPGYSQKNEPGIDPKYATWDDKILPTLFNGPDLLPHERIAYLSKSWLVLTKLFLKCGRVLFDVGSIRATDTSQFIVMVEEKMQRNGGKCCNKSLLHATMGNSVGPFSIPMDVGGYYRFNVLGGGKHVIPEQGLYHCGFGLPALATDYLVAADSKYSVDLFESSLVWTLVSSHPVDIRFEQALRLAGGANSDVASLITAFTRSPGLAIITRGYAGVGIFTCKEYVFPVLNIAELCARQMYFAHFQKSRAPGGDSSAYAVGGFYPHALRMVATTGITSGDLSFYQCYREAPNYKNIGIDVEACTLRAGIRTNPDNGARVFTIPIIDDGETSECFSGDGNFFKVTSFPAILDEVGTIDMSYEYNKELFPAGQLIGPTLSGLFCGLGIVYDEYSFLKGIYKPAVSFTAPEAMSSDTTTTGYNLRSILARATFEWGDVPTSLASSTCDVVNVESDLFWLNCNNGKLSIPTTDGRVGALNMSFVNRLVSVIPGPPVSSSLLGSNKITCQNIRGDAILMETTLFNKENQHCAARFFNSCFVAYTYYPKEITSHTGKTNRYRIYLSEDDIGVWKPLRGAAASLTAVSASIENPAKGVLMAFVDSTSRDLGGPGDAFLNTVESHGAGGGQLFGTLFNLAKNAVQRKIASNHRGYMSSVGQFVAPKASPLDYNGMKTDLTSVTIKDKV